VPRQPYAKSRKCLRSEQISSDQHERFVSSVTRGKNQMPPWGNLLSAADVEALWAYVMAGEPR
jgi:mono/diheme cytochrome c family protein